MPELLDQIRADMSTRLSQLRPLVEEHQRLQAALGALADVAAKVPGSAAPDSTRSFAPATRRAGTASKTAPTRARKRAARGANRQAVMRAVQQRPGATSAELAAVSGVQPSTLYPC